MSEQEWPAFRPEFEGHIGGYEDVQEDNDKANGKRMEALYGKVVRQVGDGSWRYWNRTHWAVDKGAIIKQAAQDLSAYMEDIELARCLDEIPPSFPEDWSVGPEGAKPYKSLLGKNGALTNAPIAVMGWVAKSPERAKFIGERLKAEQADQLYKDLAAWLKRTKSDAGMNAAIRQIGANVTASPEDFDRVRETFTVLNGQIDTSQALRVGHRLEDLNTRLCCLRYNKRAEAPLWNAFLRKNVPNRHTRRYLQKLIGYALSGKGNQKLIVFLYSKMGDTGKSVFIKVIEAMFGTDYALQLAKGALAPRREDGGRDPDREDIRGKRFVVGSELKPNQPMDETFVKQLTGGDGVNTRGNYSREGNKRWQPECLVMVATNHLSRINAEDEAIWNRIQVVPWTVAFPPGHPDRDDTLAEKIIADELEGVLAWAVEGLVLFNKEGLVPPAEVVDASMVYRSDADFVQKWIAQAAGDGDIEVAEEQRDMTWRLYKTFEVWCKAEKVKDPMSMSTFKKRLEELGYAWKKVTSGEILKSQRAHHGIAVTQQTIINLSLYKQ